MNEVATKQKPTAQKAVGFFYSLSRTYFKEFTMTQGTTITIDNQEYALDNLSDVAKQQLTNLRVVDQEIARLQIQLGIAQTARLVYANGVKNNLPTAATE